ncbi:MAG: peptidase S41, partial [bacterium]|nr:peptidase S41 [bacterium]
FIYDTAARETAKITINLFRNDLLEKERDFNVSGKITHFDISPDGKKIAFASRGELFVSDIKGKFIRQLETAPGERVMEVKWLKDNKTILFTRTVDGWFNLFKIRADKNEKETQLTADKLNNRHVVLNTDRTRAVYFSGTRYVKTMDLNTSKSKTIADEEIWGFYNSWPSFSPDDEYIMFNAYRNFETDIFLHRLKSGKTINLTDSGITETDPCWSP